MRRAFWPLASALLLLNNGCAKSPVGLTVRSSNQFLASLSLAGTLNPNYYYGVAFDDAGGDGAGPVAILGNTPIQNGVVGGTFRLLVLYRGGAFRVFYRSTPSDPATEKEISGSNGLFVVTPRATQNGLNFTLDLDARLPPLPDGTSPFIFPRGANGTSIATDRFDLNVVTTNTIIRDPNDNRIKPVDAFGAQQVATPYTVQINSPRTTSVSDEANDENFADGSFSNPSSSSYVPFQNIDITSLQIGIVRSN